MRRQVIALGTAALLTLSTMTAAPAWARGDGTNWNGNVTPGQGGHDVGADVWKDGGKGGSGKDSTSVDGQTPAEAGKSLDNRKSQAQYKCDQIAGQMKSMAGQDPNNKGNDAKMKNLTGQFNQSCTGVSDATKPGTVTNVKPRPDPGYLGRRAALTLDLPGAHPVVSPDPSLNKWRMAAVGYPLWLSVDDPRSQVSTSITVEGYQVSLSAKRSAIQYNMGDGNTVSCGVTTQWTKAVKAGTPSPTCGYRYQKPSEPGKYKVTASAGWQVTWSVMGETGTIGIDKAGGVQLPVGELQSVVVHR